MLRLQADPTITLLIIHNPQPDLSHGQRPQSPPPPTTGGRPSAAPGSGKRKLEASNSIADEKKRAKVAPLSPCYLSVVGIGVDLSVSTVQAVSSIPGAKYCSVLSCNEFITSVAQEFTYDVLPTAFDINFSLSHGITFQKIFGSSELNNLRFPTHQGAIACVFCALATLRLILPSIAAVISSEFPCPMTGGNVNGGIYLCHLNAPPGVTKGSLAFTWKAIDGSCCR
jgi:hypothetical protein